MLQKTGELKNVLYYKEEHVRPSYSHIIQFPFHGFFTGLHRVNILDLILYLQRDMKIENWELDFIITETTWFNT